MPVFLHFDEGGRCQTLVLFVALMGLTCATPSLSMTIAFNFSKHNHEECFFSRDGSGKVLRDGIVSTFHKTSVTVSDLKEGEKCG
jgi:hypothetical protein